MSRHALLAGCVAAARTGSLGFVQAAVAQAEDPCAAPPPGAIVGTDGSELLLGTPGPDFIVASGGDDLICGASAPIA
jgi:RTX calcium-binding nonapeptide repeat (4 copies)